MNEELRTYLGDSVYVAIEDGMIKLTTENSGSGPDNTIFLEPKVLDAFNHYIEQVKQY